MFGRGGQVEVGAFGSGDGFADDIDRTRDLLERAAERNVFAERYATNLVVAGAERAVGQDHDLGVRVAALTVSGGGIFGDADSDWGAKPGGFSRDLATDV